MHSCNNPLQHGVTRMYMALTRSHAHSYDLGVIGGALLGITEDLGIAGPGSLAQSLVVGAFKMGAFFGTFYGGAAMLRYGRRATIALNSGFAAAGPVIMALSSNTT